MVAPAGVLGPRAVLVPRSDRRARLLPGGPRRTCGARSRVPGRRTGDGPFGGHTSRPRARSLPVPGSRPAPKAGRARSASRCAARAHGRGPRSSTGCSTAPESSPPAVPRGRGVRSGRGRTPIGAHGLAGLDPLPSSRSCRVGASGRRRSRRSPDPAPPAASEHAGETCRGSSSSRGSRPGHIRVIFERVTVGSEVLKIGRIAQVRCRPGADDHSVGDMPTRLHDRWTIGGMRRCRRNEHRRGIRTRGGLRSADRDPREHGDRDPRWSDPVGDATDRGAPAPGGPRGVPGGGALPPPRRP